MKDYEYIDENGDYIDYWTLVEDNKELCRENKQFKIQISAREEEYKKLEDNWNKLKEYIEKTKIKEFEKSYGKRYGKTFTQAEIIVCNMIKDMIKELERGGVSDVKN